MRERKTQTQGAPWHYTIALVAVLLMAALFVALRLATYEDVTILDAVPVHGSEDPWIRRMRAPAGLAEGLRPGMRMLAHPNAGASYSGCRAWAVIGRVSQPDVSAADRVVTLTLAWSSPSPQRACLDLAGAPFAVAVPAGRRSYVFLLRRAFLRD
jgi:hypothetical protein